MSRERGIIHAKLEPLTLSMPQVTGLETLEGGVDFPLKTLPQAQSSLHTLSSLDGGPHPRPN